MMKLCRIVLPLLSFANLLAFLLVPGLTAAAPQTLHFQGTLLDPAGAPITGEETVSFRFYDSSEGGHQLPLGAPWEEELSVNVSGGLFSVLLGKGLPIPAAVFDGDTVFLELQVGTDLPMTDRIEISGAPYAFKAKVAETVPTNYSSQVKFTNPSNSFSGDWFSGNSAGFAALTVEQSVGIGTSDPEGSLDIVSPGDTKLLIHANDPVNDRNPELELKAGNTDAGGHSVLKFGKTAGSAGESLQLQNDAGNPVMTVQGNGNLGIGTTAPNKRLTVAGGGVNSAPAEVNDAGNNASGHLLVLRTKGNGTNGANLLFRSRDKKNWGMGGEDSGDAFQLREDPGDGQYGSGFGSVRLHVAAGGNVGIGTSSPDSKLTVVVPYGVNDIAHFRSQNGDADLVIGAAADKVSQIYTKAGQGLSLGTNQGVERLRITSGGAVGIGTSNPSASLEVWGDGAAVNISQNPNVAGNVRLSMNPAGDNNTATINLSSALIQANTKDSSLLLNPGNGNVGIGTYAPTQRLEVAGNVKGSGLCIGADCRTSWPSGGSGGVGGAGTTNRISKWTSSNGIGDSQIIDDGVNVGIGTTSPDHKLVVTQTAGDKWAIRANSNARVDNFGAVRAEDKCDSNSDPAGCQRNIYGIYGSTESRGSSTGSSVGVRGDAFATNPAGGATFGVLGYVFRTSPNTQGVSASAGVYGGAIGGDSGMAHGVQGETNSKQTGASGVYGAALNSGGTVIGVYGQTKSTAGWGVFSAGPTGATGYKSAIVYTDQQGPTELYAVESPEVWFEDTREAHLVNGRVVVRIDPLFLQTVTINEQNPFQVFVQVYDDVDVYVKRNGTSFEVIEKHGGKSSASFAYRIVAKRKHYENLRMRATPVTVDKFMRPDLTPEQRKALNTKWNLSPEK